MFQYGKRYGKKRSFAHLIESFDPNEIPKRVIRPDISGLIVDSPPKNRLDQGAFWESENKRISAATEIIKSAPKKATFGKKADDARVAEEWIFHRLLSPETCRLVFTDGSCRPNPGYGGSAAILIDSKTVSFDASMFPKADDVDGDRQLLRNRMIAEMELFLFNDALLSLGFTTNNICELTAVDLGLQLVEKDCVEHKSDHPSTYWIVTDSTYSIGVLSKTTQAHQNKELIERILSHIEQLESKYRIHIKFRWVPSHAYIRYNEQVDSLSKKAAHKSYLMAAAASPTTKNKATASKQVSKEVSKQVSKEKK